MALSKRIVCLAVLALTTISASPVKADQIDGNWCRGLKQLSIDGHNIITPGGTKMTGEYDRHGFRYVVPASEPDAGAAIIMSQVDDGLMQLSTSAKPDDLQDWNRCDRKIS